MTVLKKAKPFLFTLLLLLMIGMNTPVSAAEDNIRIVFIGDSLSAGLGVEPEQAYPALIDGILKKKGFQNIRILNGSISGSTTASAVSRLKWFLKMKPDILILALGANDGLRGLPTEMMEKNLDSAITLARQKNIRVILAGMKLPPNYGPEYAEAFESVFPKLAQKHSIALIPFLLKDVAGKASLNQADGIHPNPAGHRIMAKTVLSFILDDL